MPNSQFTRRASTQDVSWFLDMYANGQLDLNPSYQRRSVWGAKDRKFFLDTIFRGFPCPPIYLHKKIQDGRSVYAVVDGKQRIETVLMFADNKIAMSLDFGDTKLNGKKWKQVKEDVQSAEAFLNYVFPVEFVVLPFENSDYVNDVFERLNRNSKILNQQELRHAKYAGWFIRFAEEEVADSVWQETKVWTKARARRMADVQFVSELMLAVIRKDICGFSQETLDALYATYEDIEDFDADNEWHFPILLEDEFRELMEALKNGVSAILRADARIREFLSDSKHLYSLWCYLLLRQYNASLPELDTTKYLRFIELYRTIEDASAAGGSADWDPSVYKYYDASRGATTEEPQRRQRQVALAEYMGREE